MDKWIYDGASTTGINWCILSETRIDLSIYRDGHEIAGGGNVDWVFYRLDYYGVGPGTYNITILVTDVNGYHAVDTVWLTIYSAPSITDIADDIYTQGEEITLEWTISNILLGNYTVRKDGVIIDEGEITSTSQVISIEVSLTSIGLSDYTCEVDEYGDTILYDSVYLTVEDDDDNPTLNSPEDISYHEDDTGFSISWTPIDANPN